MYWRGNWFVEMRKRQNSDCTYDVAYCGDTSDFTYLLTSWSRVLLEKLTSKLCS